jgi:hypothetical protein
VREVERVLKPGGSFALVDNIAADAESTPGFSDGDLAQAAVAYNAFEKLRDPSHGRCLGMAEWSDVISATGLQVTHKERLPKDMEFDPWAVRLGADAPTVEALRATLSGAEGALAAFLKPRMGGSALWFTLDEAILIARKPT